MSRVGENPITLPQNVQVQVDGDQLTVTGPKGMLQLPLRPEVVVHVEDGKVIVKRKRNDRLVRSLHGLTRSLINNMVVGVTNGWSKDLELVGVGYRAQGGGETVTLNVGYSHPVVVKAPQGITFAV